MTASWGVSFASGISTFNFAFCEFSRLKNECIPVEQESMPNHGVDIIDGIPVHLKDGKMLAFQHGLPADKQLGSINLGTYDSSTKTATWTISESMNEWLATFRASLTGRSRK
jgi:hypothetical protein